MNLEFTEEQEALREMVRRVCAEHAPLEVVRSLEDDPTGFSPDFWKQLGELGLLGLLIPEEYGGADMSMLDAAVVYEELGRSLAPTPHFVSSVLGAGALLAAGSDEQKQEWLPKIAGGEAILTPAWMEPGNGYGEQGVQLAAAKEGEGYVLTGAKRHVHFATSATSLLVLARTDEGVDLFFVDPNSDGLSLAQQLSMGSDTQYRADFDGVRVPAANRIGAAGSGFGTWEQVMLDGIILASALANGGAEQALEITTEYCKEREQFGKPLGAFQAISHYLADATTNVAGAKTLTYEAAWARGEGRSIARLAPMAKLFATRTYRDLTAMAEQVWGGVGFTIEYDIQLYFRRAKQLQLAWYDTRHLEELVAANVLD